jgi:3-oxoacyl-[acyl-carrier protein] reductase
VSADRTAVVTGAGSGIGQATVERLRTDGWQVLGLDIAGPEPEVVHADVTDLASLEAASRRLGDAPVDALVLAAGIWSEQDDRYTSVPLDVWNRTLAVNVTGLMLSLRAFAPRLRPGSSVVTFASLAAINGVPRRDAYTASKGAVVALTRAWAADLIRLGVRVNSIAPGQVATPMTAHVTGVDTASLPLGREAHPAEIVEVVLALINPASTYLNGVVVPVDGGLTAGSALVPISPRR